VKLAVENLTFGYHARNVLHGITMQAEPMLTAVIGPNAAGKSTLLKCLAGLLRPGGTIALDGMPIHRLKREDLMEMIGYLPQDSGSRAVLTVFEAVLLGRLSCLSWRVGEDDLARTLEVLEDLGLDDLASRPLNELSGGQQQMVSIAQVLVRNPKILLMDEPTNNLDLHHQLDMFALIREISREKRLTTIMALHDLNHAARYADHIVVLDQGAIYDAGPPAAVFTVGMIRAVYGVNAKVTIDGDGLPQITPINALNSKRTRRKRQKSEG
jgi:iron complex transport system ATP-binding protein